MACYHPLHAFQVGISSKTGKPVYRIESGKVDRIRKPFSPLEKPKEYKVKKCYYDKFITEFIEIPCQKCVGCRLEYSRQWAIRCMLEAGYHKFNQFITLTYDDAHLPKDKSIHLKDLQDFFKRLRVNYERNFDWSNIRYYACGEYGDKNERPHYHAIVFNMPIHDLKYWYKDPKTHQIYYVSQFLTDTWGKGIVAVGEVTFESAAYVARYVMKKQKGPTASLYYDSKGIDPEFVTMSRRPGLASCYYNDHKDQIYECDEIHFTKKGKVRTAKPAKYFDKKFDIENPDLFSMIKEKRRQAADTSLKLKLEKTSLSKDEFLELAERCQLEKIKKLPRAVC